MKKNETDTGYNMDKPQRYNSMENKPDAKY